jgi:membrane-associated phospholipid phosphatase
MLDASSIQVNTFPSGHAAEALAAVLLTSSAPMPIAVAMSIAAVAISAGAVLGRYHYALDAVAGWLVALAVYAVASTSFRLM